MNFVEWSSKQFIHSAKYLGVVVSDDLQWHKQVCAVAKKANSALHLIALNRCPQNIKEKSYKSSVRPKLEYCSSIWDPHHQRDIDSIEMVQKRAARFVKNIPHKRTGPQPSVTAMVKDLGWETLENRRHNNRLSLMYKIINNEVEVPALYHPVPNNTREARRCHDTLEGQITETSRLFFRRIFATKSR